MELIKKNKNLLNSDGKSKIYINYYNIIKSEIYTDLNRNFNKGYNISNFLS